MDKDVKDTAKTEGGETDFRKIEDRAEKGNEAGRVDTGPKGESERPSGKSTGRDSTGINPEDPIDPESPNLIGP
ncbi:MAG: hypothetical protein M3126_12460 [Candidatus Eremiobacteraeota bacterium]|nr:hypothetical protein [Candidatus Eremiobacteraeota bacterium]